MAGTQSPAQRRFGPILLAPGVAPSQIFIYLIVVGGCAWSNSFMNLMQPLILVQQLGVSQGQIGKLAGLLATTQQCATLILINSAGAWADHVGRRALLIMTLCGFAVCLVVFPLLSAVWMLFLVRFAWGASFTGFTAGGATKAMDYPDNRSRGKFISFVLLMQGVLTAGFLAFVAAPLPGYLLRHFGATKAQSSQYSFWIIAALIAAIAVVAIVFMAKDSRKAMGQPAAKTQNLKMLLAGPREVLAHARANPRFGLILLIGFIIRSDGIIIASFMGLWIVSSAHAMGLTPIEATKTAGLIAAIISTAGFISPVIFGAIADRVDRVKLLLIAMVFTSTAFLSFGLISNPFGWGMVAVVTLVGFADGAQQVSAQALLAQEAPAHLRGATMGLFAFVGISSVMVVNLVGGILFDAVSHSAPFVMEGTLTFIFLMLALRLVYKARLTRPPEDRGAAHDALPG